jgi:hypothetical protein
MSIVFRRALASNANHAGAAVVSIGYAVIGIMRIVERRLGVPKYDSCQVATVHLKRE